MWGSNACASKMLVKLLIICALIVSAVESKDCTNRLCKLKKYFKHYEDLKCKAIKKDGERCPIRFDCPIFKNLRDDKCYFDGVPRKKIKESEVGNCYAQCQCYQYEGEKARFNCAVYDCAPPPGSDLNQDPCTPSYDLNFQCCPNWVCGADIYKLSTCNYKGEQYIEGEHMFIDPCYQCLCDKNFNNETKVEYNPNCRRIKCSSIYVDYFDSVRTGCSPVYRDRVCCPTEWKCPAPTDSIESATSASSDPKMRCKYGKQMLNVGDVVTNSDNPALKCECSVPPLLTCKISKTSAETSA